jgi:hypothetical protein
LSVYLTAGRYTLMIGGYDGSVAGGSLEYSATLTAQAAPVPLPTAVWLFGSALAGLGVFGRRNRQSDGSLDLGG